MSSILAIKNVPRFSYGANVLVDSPWSCDTAVVAALGDDTVDAGSTSGYILPDNLTIVAKAELGLALAEDGTIL